MIYFFTYLDIKTQIRNYTYLKSFKPPPLQETRSMNENVIIRSDFQDLNLVRRGKVRDVYEIDDKLLIVASDRM